MEPSEQEEDDFFTPDDSDRSASEGEQFDSMPRSSIPERGAAKKEPAQGAGRASAAQGAATERLSSGEAGGPSDVSEPRQQREVRVPPAARGAAARVAPASVPVEADIADDDDFFLQLGASGSDSDDGDDDDTAPGVHPVEHGADFPAAPKSHHLAGAGQQTPRLMASARRPAGSTGQRRKGAPESQGHGSHKKLRGEEERGRPAKKQGSAAQRGAGGLQRPKAAAGEQFKGKARAAVGGGKRKAVEAPAAKQPQRTRAQGGRKRRK